MYDVEFTWDELHGTARVNIFGPDTVLVTWGGGQFDLDRASVPFQTAVRSAIATARAQRTTHPL